VHNWFHHLSLDFIILTVIEYIIGLVMQLLKPWPWGLNRD